jgi:hypothetical protein
MAGHWFKKGIATKQERFGIFPFRLSLSVLW